MTITLRPAYLAVVAAFLGGMALVVIAVLTLRHDSGVQQTVLLPSATNTPAPRATSSPSATQEPTTAPTSFPPTLPPPLVAATAAPEGPAAAPSAPSTSSQSPVSIPAPPQPGSGYTFIGAVWADDSMPIPYCVDADNPPIDTVGDPIMTPDQFAQTVRRAFQTWQDVEGSYIAFAYQGICHNDPFDTRDQVNTVGWGWLFSTAIGATAPSATHGQFLRQSSFGQIYEMDIVVDVRYAQSFDDESEYINRALPWVLLHEIGHFIGLNHSTDPCSIMQPVIQDADPVLCEVDKAGARALYPEQ
jgi:Matrixin